MSDKWYIAGPMSGLPDLNFPAFYSVEDMLERAGIDVVNPAALDDAGLPEGVPEDEWGQGLPRNKQRFLLRDFRELVWCTGIIMLPGWQYSEGANCELALARMVGLETWEAQVSRYVADTSGEGPVIVWERVRNDLLTPDWEKIKGYVNKATLAQLAEEMELT